MRFLGRTIKYLLRSLFSIIVFLLLVGLAKMDWNLDTYVAFLNSNDWSVFHRSQPATWSDPFWSSKQISGDIADMFSKDTTDAESSGLDVYDPTFEQDLNQLSDGSLSGTTEDF
jgi:hypothetical protein